MIEKSVRVGPGLPSGGENHRVEALAGADILVLVDLECSFRLQDTLVRCPALLDEVEVLISFRDSGSEALILDSMDRGDCNIELVGSSAHSAVARDFDVGSERSVVAA